MGHQPTKVIRTLGERASIDASDIAERRQSRPVATPSKRQEQPQLAEPEYHPLGGGSAQDSARVVLAQRGIHEFAPLAPHKDKTRMTGWFRQRPQQQSQAPEPSEKKSAL